MGINGVSLFLGGGDHLVERLVRHVDYAVQLIGPEHVGLGLDYTFDLAELEQVLDAAPEIWPRMEGYDSPICFLEPEQIPQITEGLLELGYPEKHVRGILGENFLRVAEQVWK
jgi:membrane dipeptidase